MDMSVRTHTLGTPTLPSTQPHTHWLTAEAGRSNTIAWPTLHACNMVLHAKVATCQVTWAPAHYDCSIAAPQWVYCLHLSEHRRGRYGDIAEDPQGKGAAKLSHMVTTPDSKPHTVYRSLPLEWWLCRNLAQSLWHRRRCITHLGDMQISNKCHYHMALSKQRRMNGAPKLKNPTKM